MNDFYLGTDVSKGYADFILLDKDKQTIIESFQLDDNSIGHEQLSRLLGDFSNGHPGCIIYSGVESTGGYENNWYNTLCFLQDKVNIYVARINPIGTSHNSKASMDRIVTDKTAARNIAEYLVNHKKKVVYKKQDKFSSLRKQWSFVKMLTKQRTQLYNQLQSVLYTANPEVLVHCKHGYPNWLIKLLVKYPTAKQLSRATIAGLSSIRYLTEQKAAKLIASAKNSVASESDSLTENLVVSIVKQIINLTIQIKKQSKLIADNCQLPEIELLRSFKGVGDESAVGLMLEIVSIEKFSKARNLASYFGLHPIYKNSGDGVWGYHMSKQGRKEPRRLLFMVAKTAMVHNPLIKEIYTRKVKAGMNKSAAIGLLMHKILRIIFGMLKNKEKFNPEKDTLNSRKSLKESVDPQKAFTEKIRRYQSLSIDAPISNRQARKRKEQEKSQNEITSLNTGSSSHSSE